MLFAAGGSAFNNYVCETHKEEIQGAAACSFILLPLLPDSRSCVQLKFRECNGSCKRELAIDKAGSTTLTTEPLSDRSAMLSQRMWLLSDQTSCWLNSVEIDYLDVILREKASLVWTR